MKNLLKNIKGAISSLFNSRPAKILKTVAYVVGGLIVLSGLMNVLTNTVTAFKGLSKAIFG
jgi:hypothetical protein